MLYCKFDYADNLPQGKLNILDAVCSSEDPFRRDEAASTDVPPAPTAVWLEWDLSRALLHVKMSLNPAPYKRISSVISMTEVSKCVSVTSICRSEMEM